MMKEGRRLRLTDNLIVGIAVVMLVVSLWIVRCSSKPQPEYFVSEGAPSIELKSAPDSIPTKQKKEKTAKNPVRPIERNWLDEPVEN